MAIESMCIAVTVKAPVWINIIGCRSWISAMASLGLLVMTETVGT